MPESGTLDRANCRRDKEAICWTQPWGPEHVGGRSRALWDADAAEWVGSHLMKTFCVQLINFSSLSLGRQLRNYCPHCADEENEP